MEKVLVVDGNATSLAICRALLDTRYELALAKSGVEAMGFLKSGFIPDAILMAVVMPGTTGMEMLKALKQDKKWGDIPVLLFSSRDDLQLEAEAFRNGAVDYLRKPVDSNLLYTKLERQIGFERLKKENRRLKARVDELEKKAE